jgi:hypothetical protein
VWRRTSSSRPMSRLAASSRSGHAAWRATATVRCHARGGSARRLTRESSTWAGWGSRCRVGVRHLASLIGLGLGAGLGLELGLGLRLGLGTRRSTGNRRHTVRVRVG